MDNVDDYDSIMIAYIHTDGRNTDWTLYYIDWLQISVNDQIVAIFEPTVGNLRHEIVELPMIIDLPNKLNVSDKITAMGYFSDPEADEIDEIFSDRKVSKVTLDEFEFSGVEEGEYNIPVYIQNPPEKNLRELLEKIKD